jgi:P27 family predicted phage terminase small subunit
MRSGPPPEPLRLRVLKGNPSKRKLPRNEPLPELTANVPEPPSFVTGYAADEWWTVAPELHRLGLLTKLDTMTLAAYVMSCASWRKAAEALARMEANDPVMSGLIIKSKYGDAIANPMVSVARKHAGDMVRYASEFGLSAAARARLAAGGFQPPSPASKFDGLLSDGGDVVPLRPRDGK